MLCFDNLKYEVERLYDKIPAYAAVIQNDTDIGEWLDRQLIDTKQANELRALNKNLYACNG